MATGDGAFQVTPQVQGPGGADEEEWKEWQEWRQWRQWKGCRQNTRQTTQDTSKISDTNKQSTTFGSESGLLGEDDVRTRTARDKGETHYVLAGQPTGWAALDRVIREFDEEKVRDCKEDIDTLLVFAGLFSAVLTAFLVESYSLLLEDTAGESLAALRQIVAQTSSYQAVGGFTNSTVAPTADPAVPFQPSATNIRINVLWFASLLFSLIAASFGILVKQWLREYLAVQNPSPQARLRVRHLRYPELAKWQIFEIAAFLPLLLQLSLALFFTGLCYFTASVHPSIGYTALPLVAGWAFCFITVTLLPLFYPRCPYRTTLLRIVFALFHRLVGRIASQVASRAKASLFEIRGRGYLSKVNLWFHGNIYQRFSRMARERDETDEASVVRINKKDLEILADADAVQSNDELLATTIAEAASQVTISPDMLVGLPTFVLRILFNRLAMPTHYEWTYALVVDLRTTNLTARARNAVLDMIEHYYGGISPDDAASFVAWDGSLQATFVLGLMLSLSGRDVPQIPPLASLLSSRSMSERIPEFCCEIVRRARRSSAPTRPGGIVHPYANSAIHHLLTGLTGLQDVLDHWVKPTWILDAMLRQYGLGGGTKDSEDGDDFMHEDDLSSIPLNVASWPWQTMPDDLKVAAINFLHNHLQHLQHLIDFPDTPSLLRPGTRILAGRECLVDTAVVETLVTLFCTARYQQRLWSRASWRLICWKMLSATPASATTLASAVSNTPSADILCSLLTVVPTSMRHRFRSQQSPFESQQDMLSCWKSVLTRTSVPSDPLGSGFIFRLCCFSMYSLILVHGHQSPGLLREAWLEIFTLFAGLIERIDSAVIDSSDGPAKAKIKKLATACLEVIRHEEVNARSWEEWPWTVKKGVLVFRAHSEGSLDKVRRMIADWRSPPLHSVFPEQLVVALERFAEPSWWEPVDMGREGVSNDMHCICHGLLCPRIGKLKTELIELYT